jgi:thiamine biosynthesis protein ThiC
MEQDLKQGIRAMRENEDQQAEIDRQQLQQKINAATLAVVATLGPLNSEARQRVLQPSNVMIGTKITR